MSHPFHHSLSSVKRFGGQVADYLFIHNFLDSSKELHGDFRHRALYHHAQGIFECERRFGVTLTNSDGKSVPVRLVAEAHVIEDLGYIPSLSDWLKCIQPAAWMNRPRRLSRELEQTPVPEETK